MTLTEETVGAAAGTTELLELRERYVPRVAAASYTPIVAARGRGAEIEDVDGRWYLDFAAGIGTLNVGHCHPAVVEAVHQQVDRLLHTCFTVSPYEPYIILAARLAQLAPIAGPAKAIFFNSGAEAVENAVKIARLATGRQAIVGFANSFHGRTLMAITLTGKATPYKAGLGPFAPEVYHAPYPYPYHERGDLSEEQYVAQALETFHRWFAYNIAPRDVAAVIMEPVQGEGGFVVPPRGFLRGVAEFCAQHGIVFVADEIQTGFGRTGRMFAVEHEDVHPDLLLVAKSLAGGLPLSGVVGRADLMDAPPPGTMGGTYAGNPVSCAAALAVLDVFAREGLVERAGVLGTRSLARLQALQAQVEAVGDVRGLGAMVAVELVKDRRSRQPDPALTAAVLHRCHDRGLIVIKAGTYDNVVRLLMPLVTTDEQLERGLGILEGAVLSLTASA
jgi:4-aminobutyrate aminotransferase/(S)-3-amino-2-methylpropionate transaminase